MAVLKLTGEEIKTFPAVLREYANYMVAVRGISEKTICEYLLDLRSFFRYYKMKRDELFLSLEELEEMPI